MVEIWFPYGNTDVSARMHEEDLLYVLDPKKEEARDPQSELRTAIEDPVGTSRISEIVHGRKSVAIVLEDDGGLGYNRLLLQCLLDELKEPELGKESIQVILADSSDNTPNGEYTAGIIGDGAKRCQTTVHDSSCTPTVLLGKTSFGTKAEINRRFSDAEVKILTGRLGFHWQAGYSGGRHSILGVSSISTILNNYALGLNPNSKAGTLTENPVHLDLNEIAEMAHVDFAVDLALDPRGGFIRAFAGSPQKSFLQAVKFIDDKYKIPVKKKADVLVVGAGGERYDNHLLRAFQTACGALDAVRDEGAAILIAECGHGHGDKAFYDWSFQYRGLEEIESAARRKLVLGGLEALKLRKFLARARLYLVSTLPDYYATGVFKLRTGKTVNAALQLAVRAVGRESKAAAIPSAAATLPVLGS